MAKRYLFGVSYGDNPNPHPLDAACIFDTFEECEQASDDLLRESFDYGSCAIEFDDTKLIPAYDLERKIVEQREIVRHEQLAMYCQFLPQFQDTYTPGRYVTAWGQTVYLRGVDPFTAASQLSTEVLERLWMDDDWGSAWECFDMEQREIWEYDDGLIAAYDVVLGMLRPKVEEVVAA